MIQVCHMTADQIKAALASGVPIYQQIMWKASPVDGRHIFTDLQEFSVEALKLTIAHCRADGWMRDGQVQCFDRSGK